MMNFMRSTPFIIALILILPAIQARPAHLSSSNNIKDYIKYLLSLTGVENEYARFLNYLKIYPPMESIRMREFYDGLFSTNAYLSDLIRLYAKYYTLDEINELINFYSSSAGKKSLQVSAEINRQIEDTMLNKISDYIFTSSENGFNIPLLELQQ